MLAEIREQTAYTTTLQKNTDTGQTYKTNLVWSLESPESIGFRWLYLKNNLADIF